MRILIDTSLLVEGERRNFDLGKWVVAARHEVFICDATVANTSRAAVEGRGQGTTLAELWNSFVSLLEVRAVGSPNLRKSR